MFFNICFFELDNVSKSSKDFDESLKSSIIANQSVSCSSKKCLKFKSPLKNNILFCSKTFLNDKLFKLPEAVNEIL